MELSVFRFQISDFSFLSCVKVTNDFSDLSDPDVVYYTLFLLLGAESGESVVEGGGGVEAYHCRVAL